MYMSPQDQIRDMYHMSLAVLGSAVRRDETEWLAQQVRRPVSSGRNKGKAARELRQSNGVVSRHW